MNYHRFFGFRSFWQDRAQDTRKVTKMLPKARQVASKFASLAHLGSNLAHLGAKKRPNRLPHGTPDASLLASCTILAPRGSFYKCSKTAPRLDFLVFVTALVTILDRFPFIFHLPLNRISKSILPSMIDFLLLLLLLQFLLSISNPQVSSFGTVAACRVHAHWIYDFYYCSL